MAHKIIRTFPGQRTPVVNQPFIFYDEVLGKNFLMHKVIRFYAEPHPGAEGSTIYYLDGPLDTIETDDKEYVEWQAMEMAGYGG